MMNKYFLLISFVFCFFEKGYTQKFEWVKSYGSTGGENYPYCFQTKNASYLAWTSFFSTKFDSFSKQATYYSPTIFAVGKTDINGNAIWLWTSDSIIVDGSTSIKSILYDSASEMTYITGQLTGKLYCENMVWSSFYNQSRNKYISNGFIVKLNNKGKLINMIVLNDSNQNIINCINSYKKNIIISVTITLHDKSKFCALNNPCYDKSGIIVCQINSKLDVVLRSSLLVGNIFEESLHVNGKEILLTSYADNINIKDTSLAYNNSKGGYYGITFDHNLKIKSVGFLYSGTTLKTESSLTENGNIVVATGFYDSIIFKNMTLHSDQYIKPIILIFDNYFNIKYASYPKVSNSSRPGSQYYTIKYHKGFIYAAGTIQGDLGDYQFGDIKTLSHEGTNFITKLDLWGNFLWAKRFSTSKKFKYVNDISTYENTILVAAVYNDTTYLNSHQFISKGSLDLLVAKIHDIDILRGYVKSGPYCAGDTIEIPYTKNGEFNKGNEFIAQLSDEDGNFTGDERELGRISSTGDSLIQGILPLFDVASSPNYRIRILSTNPVVQSYYKYDTLRLLIFSKDAAFAGKDTSICTGQSVKLSTSGGSRWRWSPGDLVKDSTQKTTLATPFKTTTFRVIISDSSGCGKIDTAYKTINIRPPLQIKGLPKDTTVCKDSRVSLTLIPSGGLGSNYKYQWLSAFDQPLGKTDTFSINISKEGSIKAVLSDGCTQQNDTIQINYTIPQTITAIIEKPDCFDSSLTLKMNAAGGYKNNLNHVWYRDNKAIDIGKTINLSGITKKQWIVAYTTDYCNTKVKDSVLLFPNPKASLRAGVDSVCQSEPFILYNQSNTHAPINTQLSWLNHQKPWKKQDTLLVFEDLGTHSISINITDSLGCTSNNSIDVNIIEKPVADFAIFPQNPTADHTFFELIPTQSGNKKYTWTIGRLILSQNSWQSLRLPIKDTVSYLATLKVANAFGCVDSVIKTIRIGESDAFYIPNAVSRNNDGLNDDFAPYGWKIQSYDMLIVARTNQVVYKGSTPWKPTYEAGVYSYRIKVKFKDGSENTYKGYVHVIH